MNKSTIDTRRAIEDIRRFAPMFQAVLDIAAALEDIDNLERAAREASGLLEAKRSDLADIEAMRQQAQADHDAAVAGTLEAAQHNERAEKSANAKVASIIAKAKAEAEAVASSIAKDAKYAADNLREEAGVVLKQAERDAAAMRDATEEKDSAVRARDQVLKDIENAITARRGEYEELAKKISAAKSHITKLLEG